jgi:hypothetical protein
VIAIDGLLIAIDGHGLPLMAMDCQPHLARLGLLLIAIDCC